MALPKSFVMFDRTWRTPGTNTEGVQSILQWVSAASHLQVRSGGLVRKRTYCAANLFKVKLINGCNMLRISRFRPVCGPWTEKLMHMRPASAQVALSAQVPDP